MTLTTTTSPYSWSASARAELSASSSLSTGRTTRSSRSAIDTPPVGKPLLVAIRRPHRG
ncbi:hypothetical protein ACFQL1_13905 [Halomicroarcula sp. GCM10025709]|uniref:hypothetical protein n=1 Tax=Halomicroarcula sp. GCM10025709 TaxID=3252669 RepID=UPI00360D98EC